MLRNTSKSALKGVRAMATGKDVRFGSEVGVARVVLVTGCR
jgi:hypothetical protein